MRSFDDTTELEFEGSDEASESFDEMEELDLATSLLEVNDEQELDQFLGKLIKKVGRSVASKLPPEAMRTLRDLLKKAAKKALPFAAGVTGAVSGPEDIQSAGEIFGLELEGLSPEDQEFEVARRFVRFARGSARNAAAGRGRGNAAAAARAGTLRAARKHAPGLLRPKRRPTRRGRVGVGGGGPMLSEPIVRVRGAGQWFRRGRHIIIVNCGGAADADGAGASKAEPGQDVEPTDTAATGAAANGSAGAAGAKNGAANGAGNGAAGGAPNGAGGEPSLEEF